MDQPKTCRIKRIVKENRKAKTFFLDYHMDIKSGQFLMLWIPGLDEKPFACSYDEREIEKGMIGVTVEKKGIFTKKLFSMKEGDLVGVRGPYGHGFSKKKNALAVAGGLGIASLARLIKELNCEAIIGAKTREELLFKGRFERAEYTTDDGSYGYKGVTTELLEKKLKAGKYSVVYTCGPEIMMKKVFELCKRFNVECEASLERFMRCGFGVCGSCACNNRIVCKEGPVFDSKALRDMKDFGNYAILKSGRKEKLNEYFGWRQNADKKS